MGAFGALLDQHRSLNADQPLLTASAARALEAVGEVEAFGRRSAAKPSRGRPTSTRPAPWRRPPRQRLDQRRPDPLAAPLAPGPEHLDRQHPPRHLDRPRPACREDPDRLGPPSPTAARTMPRLGSSMWARASASIARAAAASRRARQSSAATPVATARRRRDAPGELPSRPSPARRPGWWPPRSCGPALAASVVAALSAGPAPPAAQARRSRPSRRRAAGHGPGRSPPSGHAP